MKISLKAARVNADLIIVEVAKAIEIDRNTLGRYEKGRTLLSMETLLKLCRLYEVGIENIFLLFNYALSVRNRMRDEQATVGKVS